MGWIKARIGKANWIGLLVWIGVLVLFSFWAFTMDSPWTRALAAAGGALPEMQPGIPAIEPVRSLQAMGENTGSYLLWQILDVPYAVMNFMVISSAMGLGLKAVRLETGILRFALLLPALYVVCELIENALLAAFAAEISPLSEPLVLAQQAATTLKFASSMMGGMLAVLGLVVAAIAAGMRLVRK
ncbi:hypothetical protein [Hyphococcus sp.]|uniref:hypothetical protein n=1 Tax=Hyphococcus sp. TaxID=2038636 RepID=UPI003CCB821D